MSREATTLRDIPEGSAEPWGHFQVAKLPLLGALPFSLAEETPLEVLVERDPALFLGPQSQHSSGLWGSAFGAAGWNEFSPGREEGSF